jgi:hypothetical protein
MLRRGTIVACDSQDVHGWRAAMDLWTRQHRYSKRLDAEGARRRLIMIQVNQCPLRHRLLAARPAPKDERVMTSFIRHLDFLPQQANRNVLHSAVIASHALLLL